MITEKILAAHAGLKEVEPWQLINARVDLALGNDITAPVSIREFEEAGFDRVFDPDKIVLVLDHFAPNKDIPSAQQCKTVREFAKKHGIVHFYEGGQAGVEHALLPEQGLVLPGEVVVGADSHTCTYGGLGAFSTGVGSTDLTAAWVTGELWFKVPPTMKFIYYGKRRPWVGGKDLILHTIGDIGVDGALYRAMEFTGEAISELPVNERLTMANMAIEAGGKNGIFPPDQLTGEYLKKRTSRSYTPVTGDDDARYVEVREYDISKIESQVALPHLPSNVRGVSEVKGVAIDQAVIGSCTNGRLEDLQIAARVLQGRKIAPGIRLIVIPATPEIYHQAMKEGLFDIFLDAGGIVSPPTCGPCLGGFMGVLAEGERAVATTNRNFVGRMGHTKSEVYLSGPAVAAASAVCGQIAGPQELGL